MWLYDPCTNILIEKTLTEIADMSGYSASNISRAASKERKLPKINSYVFKAKPTLNKRKELYRNEYYDGEVWKTYKDTNYEVSNYGRVKKNCKTTTVFMLPILKKNHLITRLLIENKRHELKIKHLVAEVFLPKEPGKCCVAHKNSNYTDCSVWNIERINRSIIARKSGSKANSKPVVLVGRDSDIIDFWRSARVAGSANYMSAQAIVDRCNGKVKQDTGTIFLWEEDYYKNKIE